MRELERDLPATEEAAPSAPAAPTFLTIVGSGRAGGAIAAAAGAAGLEVTVLGRDDRLALPGARSAAVLLCVPDAVIASACDRLAGDLTPEVAVGHVSGATTLDALAGAAARGCSTFSLHPLQTIPDRDTALAGSPCAVAGSGPRGTAVARGLAAALGMRAFEVPEEGRAAYHAAAAMASNFLVALEESAAGLLAAAGVERPREVLASLVLRTAANWADAGDAALTGPIARGDEETVTRHLDALADRAPELRPLYEALAERTRAIAEGLEAER